MGVGLKLPTSDALAHQDGRWIWIVSDGTGFQVSTKSLDRCGVPVYLGLSTLNSESLGFVVRQRPRVWLLDHNGDLDDPRFVAAVRAHLARVAPAPDVSGENWAALFDAPGRRADRARFDAYAMAGAVVVMPILGMSLGVSWLVLRLIERLRHALAQRSNRCPNCRYALSGLDVDDAPRCPECGSVRAPAAAAT